MINAMLSNEQVAILRTPEQLCDYLNKLVEYARNNDDVLRDAMLKKGLFKQIVQEMFPVSNYTLHQYRDADVLVRIVLGNQGYDAEVLESDGDTLVERIEVTKPCDGYSNHQDSLNVIKRGYGEFRMFAEGDAIRSIGSLILDTARNKAKKDYSDSTLLFVLDVLPHHCNSAVERQEIDSIVNEMRSIRFLARKVVLLCPDGQVIDVRSAV